MNTQLPRPKTPIPSQPARDVAPRRLIVTASVVIFAVRDWSLWVLLRDGPWGPPMRLVLGTESVTDAVDRTIEALLMWPARAPLLQLKAGWQEHMQPVPSLRVGWTPVMAIESGQRTLDSDVHPGLQAALHTLRSQVQRDPEIVLQYLADMGTNPGMDWHKQEMSGPVSKDTLPLAILKEPAAGDGVLTLAEATLLYRAFFPPDEQVDLSNLRRRFLATNRLEALGEERPVRGRELDWRRVSRAYRYRGPGV